MDQSDKAHMTKHGFVFMPNCRSSEAGLKVAESLGELLCLGNDDPLHKIVVRNATDASPNTYSGIYGVGDFPFHTDLAHWVHPPRFLFLRCQKGYDEVSTLLIDSNDLVDQVGSALLSRSLVQPRRPINLRLPLLRIFRPNGSKPALFRWDETFLRPCGATGRKGMLAVKEQIATTRPITVKLAKRGDTLLVDNWRMLHARSRIPPGCELRCIERAYIGGLH